MKGSALLATSDPGVRDQIDTLLGSMDYTTTFESVGSRAILRLLENEFDFFILDLDHEHEIGFDILGIIKKTRPKIPIVVLCKHTSVETVRRVTNIGVFYCVVKPLHAREMESVIQALERHQQRWRVNQQDYSSTQI